LTGRPSCFAVSDMTWLAGVDTLLADLMLKNGCEADVVRVVLVLRDLTVWMAKERMIVVNK